MIKDLRGDYARAVDLYERAQAVYERILGAPGTINIGMEQDLAITQANAGIASWKRGDLAPAVKSLARAHEVHERSLWMLFPRLTEVQQQLALQGFTHDTDALISFHQRSAPGDHRAARLALTTILQRKGRGLEALTEATAGLHRRIAQGDHAPRTPYETEEDHVLRDRLRAVHGRLAELFHQRQEGTDAKQLREEIAGLEREEQNLKTEMGGRLLQEEQWDVNAQLQRMIKEGASRERIRTAVREMTLHRGALPQVLDQVQGAIPDGMVLVEMALYRPFNPKAEREGARWGGERYIAYILHPRGVPASVDLGEAAVIDRAIVELRRALSDPSNTSVTQIARGLDERLMRPIRPFLGSTPIVLIAPEGMLNLVPFGALVDETKQYLVERFLFTYLTTGRDLLGFNASSPAVGRPVIIADPDFGTVGNGPTSARFALPSLVFDRLPGTAAEAQAIQAVLPNAELLTGKEASESALKQLMRPRILHLATHGFFLRDADLRGSGQQRIDSSAGWNPLLRSGLVFAGVNQGQDGRDDGVLTALEATGLDLSGTGLVVLSACETGLGDTKNGEGVYGLRRALAMAGAESQLVSLWNVDDAATKELMVDYYQRLLSGTGRSEALRQTQRQMLTKDNRKHPFYWASFILSGRWTRLEATE